MTDQSTSERVIRFLIIAAAIVIVIYAVNQAQAVVSLFIVSIFIALIGTPAVLWLERKRIPSFVSVIIVMIGLIALILSIAVVVGASLNNFSEGLPLYQKQLQLKVLALKPLLASKHIFVTDKVLLEYINPGPILGYVVDLISGMGAVISNIVLILFMVMFILLEASSFPVKIRSVLDDSKAVFPQFTKFVDDMKRYMVIKIVINFVTGALTTVWLIILGVDFPVLWGFLTFLLHFIPSVGSIIAAVPAVLLALIQLGNGPAALTGLGYLAIGTIIGNIIEPRIMGHRLGLSTLVVFVSLIFWGNLLGVVGALLCVPLTMSLKLACEASNETRWIAVLLGPEIPAESESSAAKKGNHFSKIKKILKTDH